MEAQGGTALPIQCNVRKEGDLHTAVKQCIDKFGSLDYAIYNAGAIFWDKVENTTLKRLVKVLGCFFLQAKPDLKVEVT